MRVYYCDPFDFPLPQGHRFPLEKYRLLRQQLQSMSWSPPLNFAVPPPVSEMDLFRAHDPDYVRRMLRGQVTEAEMRRIGFPWSAALVHRACRSAGGTLSASRAALADGVAANLAGGTHHAGPNWGEGFCLFNDSIIAIRALQAEGRIRRAVVLDCDVHQGNGTAAIAASDSTIFTFSIHNRRNFPLRKWPSDLDIDLEDGTTDEDYLAALQYGVELALQRAEADLAIFLAGADPFLGDRLGRLAITQAGLAERDRLVLAACRARGLPVAVTLAGGYARNILETVAIQVTTIQLAWQCYRQATSRPPESDAPPQS
jgi:acetoin utilization deacetylase AcuC-like enzyme